MKRSNRLVLLVGVFLAVIAFVGVILLSQGSGPGTGGQQAEPTRANVVVALEDIPLGTVIEASMVETKEVDVQGAEADAFADVSQVIGQVARQEVLTGGQVTQRTISGSAATADLKVPPGKRAMSVRVDQVTGVGTLIKTGDYVDMVIRMDIKAVSVNPGNGLLPEGAPFILEDEGAEGITGTSSKLILQGLQVIGTLLPATTTTGTTGGASPQPGGASLNDRNEIVILALTPAQTEVVKWAQKEDLVSVSLALRSPADFVDANGNPITPESPCTTVRPSPTPTQVVAESPSPAGSPAPEVPVPCEVTPGVVLSTLVQEYGVLINHSAFTVGIEDVPDELVYPSFNPDTVPGQP